MVPYPNDGPKAAEIDQLAGRLLTAISAVIEYGRGNATDNDVFASATIKALIFAQAALIALPVSQPDELELALSSHDAALRTVVADFRVDAQ